MSGHGHPHVVFHQSAVKNNHDSDKKSTQKKRKKKRKRRHHSNCGTKEPRRSAEQKIEWQPQGKVNLILRRLHKLRSPSAERSAQTQNDFCLPFCHSMFLHKFPTLHLTLPCYLLVFVNKKTNFQRALL